MKNQFKKRMTLLILILVFLAIACQAPFVESRQPTATPVPVSTQAMNELIENVGEAAATAISGGQVTLVITEQQLTSLAVLEIQSQQDVQIADLQILLRDGQLKISGEVTSENITLPMSIALKVSVTAEGKPHFEVESAKLGPFPLPESVLDQLTTELDKLLISQLDSIAPNLFIESMVIADGNLTITGHLT